MKNPISIKEVLGNMRNRRMAEKILKQEAISLHNCERTPQGNYIIPEELWEEGKDYCDVLEEAWIWSIGRDNKDGKIYAATNTYYYQNPNFTCIWLR